VVTAHSDDICHFTEQIKTFLEIHLPVGEKIDLLISGENGDNRLLKYYVSCEKMMGDDVSVIRFKHMCGEYPTASAMALWLACHILQKNHIPRHMIKRDSQGRDFNNILIYNNHRGRQHSIMLVKGKFPGAAG
jgi:hypothetical protein